MRNVLQILALSAFAIGLSAAPPDAIGVIAPLLHSYDLVGIPEMHHSAENHVFLRQIVVDPRTLSGELPLFFTPSAERQAAKANTWWRGNRLAAPNAFSRRVATTVD